MSLFLEELANKARVILWQVNSNPTVIINFTCHYSVVGMRVFSFGNCSFGQLGAPCIADDENQKVPLNVGITTDRVYCGGKHAAFVDGFSSLFSLLSLDPNLNKLFIAEGFMITWGDNEFGQLGRELGYFFHFPSSY